MYDEHDKHDGHKSIGVEGITHTAAVSSIGGDERWKPKVGPEMRVLLQHLDIPQTSKDELERSSLDIISRCVSPHAEEDHETGLVIGYVQSGKTMSFTAVTALARDNGYQMVIVITGISDPLLNQSTTRLETDLRLQTRPDRKWQFFTNPKVSESRAIRDTLTDWTGPDVPDAERQTVLITVMKNHRHLDNLVELLRSLEMSGVPVLVIDDEADQAGLNTRVRQGDESATFRCLVNMRHTLPSHTYLQYTATPQAPLLINLIDILSPSFAELLTPGPEYLGGYDFFIERPELIEIIPDHEIPAKGNALTEPPETLLVAMRLFFLGVAAGMMLDGSNGNRSMLVHPSQATAGHSQYFHWVAEVKDRWQSILELAPTDMDRSELLDEFRQAYDDLHATVPDLPALSELSSRLVRAIRKTRVEEVNARKGETPHIDWKGAYSYILVGGQAMDRGFTVEGLTVTYMPRSLGVSNADTVQQRARFLGYKRRYAGYCRVFLPSLVNNAYTQYVAHEEDIRNRLLQHNTLGKPLDEWKRAFFLDRSLRPTRHNVLYLDYMHDSFADQWIAQQAPHDSEDAAAENRGRVIAFVSGLVWTDDSGHSERTPIQRHKVAVDVPLRRAYEDLLTALRITRPEDSQRFTGLLLQIGDYLEQYPNATCTVYQMSSGLERERGLNDHDEITNLFQGANPEKGKGPQIYPGDREIKAPHGITIQIHKLRVKGRDQEYGDVPAIAVWVPEEVAKDWVVQDQP